MLYGDWIDLKLDDTVARKRPQDAGHPVHAHGTGLSTSAGYSPVERSGFVSLSRPLSMGLAVAGNVVGGSLFIGSLVLAPFWLERLLGLL